MLINNKFKFKIDGTLYEHSQYITGSEIRALAAINQDSLIFLKVQGIDEEVLDSEPIDLARLGIEHFYTVPRNPTFKFTLNGKEFSGEKFITGLDLKKLGNIPIDETVYLKVQGEDEEVQDHEPIDLARHGIEYFYSKHKHAVIVTINTTKGIWSHAHFLQNTTVAEVIKAVIEKFNFAADGNYRLKIKESGEDMKPERTLGSYNLKHCAILSFTDIGKGA